MSRITGTGKIEESKTKTTDVSLGFDDKSVKIFFTWTRSFSFF